MKKLLLLILLSMLFFGCSENDKIETENNSNKELTPPSWIQGIWGYPSGDYFEVSFEFYEEKVYMFVSSIETVNLYNYIKEHNFVLYETSKTQNEYCFEMGLKGFPMEYKFVKIDKNHIDWYYGRYNSMAKISTLTKKG